MELINSLPTYIFSSQFPALRFERCGYTTVNFKVYCESVLILDTELTSIETNDQDTDDVIMLYDIGRLFEENMRKRGLERAYLEIEFLNYIVEDCTVVYCPYVTEADAYSFISEHFLTSLNAKRIPADATSERLFFARTSAEENTALSLSIEATYIDSDGYKHYGQRLSRSLGSTLRHTQDLCPSTIVGLLQAKGLDVERVISYEVTLGNRSFMYFVDNESVTLQGFRFYNAFNSEETAYIEAMTTRVTDTERSLASMHGRAVFYDQQDNEEYEVSSAPLSFAEAEWLKQMLLSHDVEKIGLGDILITDMDAKVSDNDEDHKRIKFTYRLVENGAALAIAEKATAISNARIFTNEFTLIFS